MPPGGSAGSGRGRRREISTWVWTSIASTASRSITTVLRGELGQPVLEHRGARSVEGLEPDDAVGLVPDPGRELVAGPDRAREANRESLHCGGVVLPASGDDRPAREGHHAEPVDDDSRQPGGLREILVQVDPVVVAGGLRVARRSHRRRADRCARRPARFLPGRRASGDRGPARRRRSRRPGRDRTPSRTAR